MNRPELEAGIVVVLAAKATLFDVVVVTTDANDVDKGVKAAAFGEDTEGEFCDAGDDDAAAKASAADFLA